MPTPGAIAGSQTSRSNETCTPPVPVPAMLQRLFGDRGDAGAIDVLHREDVDAGVADDLLLALVEIADADEHGVLGRAPWARSRRCATAPPARGRAAPRAACRGRCRCRELAGVFMSPCASTQISPSGLSVAAQEIRGRRDRSRREAVVAAEHEREAAFLEHGERRLVELLADARDLADVFLARIAERLGLGNRRDEIAGVDDRHAQRRQPFAEPGDAKRRGPHVDAAAVAAEVERHADDVHGTHSDGLNCSTAPCRLTAALNIR